MRVSSVKGVRKISLTKTEHDKLKAAEVIAAEISEIGKDSCGTEAAVALRSLVFKYMPPEPKKVTA